jgi:hypothetical protein
LAKAVGAKLPKKEQAKDDDDVSTEAKQLKRVAKKWPVFGDILSYRQYDKLVTSYSWELHNDSRVHSQFGHHPSTWRKSSRGPNIQTIPKRSDLAKSFRKMIVPREGHVLVEGDSAAIEAVIVGFLAGSPRYIRLAKAGVHGWLTAALHEEPISLDQPDDALSVACKAAKARWPDDYEKCKRVVHLSNYLGTPRRITEEYPEEFPREAEAARLQDFYFSTEAGRDVRAWQKHTVEIAHANKGLENHFGLRHRFYSLYAWNEYRYRKALELGIEEVIARHEAWGFGDDAKRAVAFCPQSDASFVQSDILLRLVGRDPRFLEWLVAIVHDSIVCDCPVGLGDYVAGVLFEEMVRPVAQLDGLAIGAEVSTGPNLAEMRPWQPKVKNSVANVASALPARGC